MDDSINQSQINFDKAKSFDQATSLVAEHFFDKSFNIEEWNQHIISFRSQALLTKTEDEFSNIINKLLKTLKTSHTYYFSTLNPKRYQILGIFHNQYNDTQEDLFTYEGIGIDTKIINKKTYISAVYDGFAADKAGLMFGDEIISIDDMPFHPINSFLEKNNRITQVKLNRSGKEMLLGVGVELLDGRNMFETSLESSVNVFEKNDKKIGYIHAWSYAGIKYQEIIRSTILWGKLASCDSLILDLRDGWGGADVNYLNLFRSAIVNVTSESRNQPLQNYTGAWGKPIALITNNGSTSGKELFSFGFKKLKLGQIFGEKTAGAVVAGRSFLLSNGGVLYLAVSDINVDGQRLEGQGILPDHKVFRSITQATGNDPQLQAAIDYLSEK